LWGHSGFPVRIAEAPILMTTKEGDIVLDMFSGSGTTLFASKRNNRNYIGIEISQEYIDIINKRLE
jgi:site-specific DNA-methyltransferase (adenine-specific)